MTQRVRPEPRPTLQLRRPPYLDILSDTPQARPSSQLVSHPRLSDFPLVHDNDPLHRLHGTSKRFKEAELRHLYDSSNGQCLHR